MIFCGDVRLESEARDAEHLALTERIDKLSRQHELGILGDADLTERVREVQDALERLESRAVAADLPDAIDWDGDDPRAVNAILRAAWEYVEMDEQQRPRRAAWRFPVPA